MTMERKREAIKESMKGIMPRDLKEAAKILGLNKDNLLHRKILILYVQLIKSLAVSAIKIKEGADARDYLCFIKESTELTMHEIFK